MESCKIMRSYSIAQGAKEPTPCPFFLKGWGDRLSWLWHLLLIATLQVTITSPSLAANPPSLQEGVGGRLDSDTLTILFTGDILLDRGVRRYLEHGGIRRVIPDETADFLRSSDVAVGNLECPVTTIHAWRPHLAR